MTIVELLGVSVADLEAMSDEELLEHCSPYFNITRPDQAEKPAKRAARTLSKGGSSNVYSSKNQSFLAGVQALLDTGDINKAREISKGQIGKNKNE